jgi:enterochelin esterase-like enzyme
MLNDVLPWIESNFRVRRDPAGRAIAGLSMGGFQSISIGLKHPESFGWIGVFSAGLRPGFVTASDLRGGAGGDRGRNLKLVYTRIGTSDFFLADARRFHAWLQRHSLPHVYQEVPGGHEWPVWRAALEDFLPRLFR